MIQLLACDLVDRFREMFDVAGGNPCYRYAAVSGSIHGVLGRVSRLQSRKGWLGTDIFGQLIHLDWG